MHICCITYIYIDPWVSIRIAEKMTGCVPLAHIVINNVLGCREKGQHLGQLLQNRRADAALELLSAQPALVWVRDDESGGYPLHLAVWHVGPLSCSTSALVCLSDLLHVTSWRSFILATCNKQSS